MTHPTPYLPAPIAKDMIAVVFPGKSVELCDLPESSHAVGIGIASRATVGIEKALRDCENAARAIVGEVGLETKHLKIEALKFLKLTVELRA